MDRDINRWLADNGFGELSAAFLEHEIGLDVLPTLSEQDLIEIGITKIGPRRRVMRALHKAFPGDTTATSAANGGHTPIHSDGVPARWSIPRTPVMASPAPRSPQVFGTPTRTPGADGDGSATDDDSLFQFSKHTISLPALKERARRLVRTSFFTSAYLPTWDRAEAYEWSKVAFSVCYALLVSFITALTMTVVHSRVPEQDLFPPLPDIMLDNIPHIPWAFSVAEYIMLMQGVLFVLIILLHSHRDVIIRRFNVITATVFLLRCVTMSVTSLSVPGNHLKCDASVYSGLEPEEMVQRAWEIASGMGMQVNGVQTCGDYMFSGHTVGLTMLNFFITVRLHFRCFKCAFWSWECVEGIMYAYFSMQEYTPSSWKGLHIFTWVLNIFGMFFVLAAHEHYTIDVLIAFYVSSRMFLHYHSLANGCVMQGEDGNRVRSFFPIFAYMEDSTKGVVPNEYSIPLLGYRIGGPYDGEPSNNDAGSDEHKKQE